MSKLLINAIQTPDGTILESTHRHDFKTHVDSINNLTYIIDGGLDYRRFNIEAPFIDLALYKDDDFEIIRKRFKRINRGKDGKSKPKEVFLCNMSDEWIDNLIIYLEDKNIDTWVYEKEKEYRVTNNIKIEEC